MRDFRFHHSCTKHVNNSFFSSEGKSKSLRSQRRDGREETIDESRRYRLKITVTLAARICRFFQPTLEPAFISTAHTPQFGINFSRFATRLLTQLSAQRTMLSWELFSRVPDYCPCEFITRYQCVGSLSAV